MPKKRENGDTGGDIVSKAVQRGMGDLMQNHPSFKNAHEYLLNHLDQDRLQEGMYRIQKELSERYPEDSQEELYQKFYDALSGYVASGMVFDDSAKKVVLRGGLEEKAMDEDSNWMSRFLVKKDRTNKSQKQRYLDKVTSAFGDIYSLMSSGDYGQRMPELAESAGVLKDLGFLDNAIEVLYERDLLDKHDYKLVRESIDQKAKEESQKAGNLIAKYSIPDSAKKASVFLMGVFGLGLIFLSGQGITGNVVGGITSGNLIGGLLGTAAVLGSLFFFFKKLK